MHFDAFYMKNKRYEKRVFYTSFTQNLNLHAMKRLFTFFIASLLTAGIMFAQDFNGRIKYSFTAEGEGVEQAAAFMPTSMSMTFLKQDMIMEMEGGMMAMMMGKILVQGKKGKGYMIKDSEETIYTMPTPDGDEEAEEMPEPKIENMGEKKMIAGYECTKYSITAESPMGEMTSYAWVTDKINPAKPKKEGGGSSMGMMGVSTKGLPGMPLRMENPAGPMTIILEAIEVDTKTPDKKMFKLPKGYDKEEFNPAMFGGGGGGGF